MRASTRLIPSSVMFCVLVCLFIFLLGNGYSEAAEVNVDVNGVARDNGDMYAANVSRVSYSDGGQLKPYRSVISLVLPEFYQVHHDLRNCSRNRERRLLSIWAVNTINMCLLANQTTYCSYTRLDDDNLGCFSACIYWHYCSLTCCFVVKCVCVYLFVCAGVGWLCLLPTMPNPRQTRRYLPFNHV
jgi:hypothetical protein